MALKTHFGISNWVTDMEVDVEVVHMLEGTIVGLKGSNERYDHPVVRCNSFHPISLQT